MASPGSNPHKKGEHVFNDISGSLENALISALRTERASSLILVNRHGSLSLHMLPLTAARLDRFRRDAILTHARTVVGPPHGTSNDENARTYGYAKLQLERVLSEAVAAAAELIWKKTPRANSSFTDFEVIVAGLRSSGLLKLEALAAVDRLIDCAHDPQAEAGALSERVSDTELARRRAAIAAMKQHKPTLKQAGHSLLTTFLDEVEHVLERRITTA